MLLGSAWTTTQRRDFANSSWVVTEHHLLSCTLCRERVAVTDSKREKPEING
jgi:hypothetical protein